MSEWPRESLWAAAAGASGGMMSGALRAIYEFQNQ
jgi:hypothetical protein